MSLFKTLITGNRRSWKLYYILTSIGIAVHELAHKWIAESRGLEIEDYRLFTLEDTRVGYVKLKTPPRTYTDLLAVNIAPFFLNTLLAFFIMTCILTAVYIFDIYNVEWSSMIANVIIQLLPIIHIEWASMIANVVIQLLPIIFILMSWVAISISLHAFPSQTDLNNIYTGKKLVWNATEPKVLTWLSNKIHERAILFMLLGIIYYPLRILHVLIYTITHPQIILGFPFIIIVDLLSRTKKYGSNFIFTGGLIYLSYYSTMSYLSMVSEL